MEEILLVFGHVDARHGRLRILAPHVRANPRYDRPPAIAVSGMRGDHDIARARNAGFPAQLGKPGSIDRLNAIVQELLPARRVQGGDVSQAPYLVDGSYTCPILPAYTALSP